MKISDIFDIIQGHQITDEELYRSEGNIPVYTGRNEIKGYWNQSLVTEEQLPCITYPTKGNTEGFAYIQESIFDANNTAVLLIKEEWKGGVDLEWFVFKLSHIFLEKATSNASVSYLNKAIVEDYEVDIPDIKSQEKELKFLKVLQAKKKILEEALEKINKLMNRVVLYD